MRATGKGKFIIELVRRARRPDGLPDVATMSDRDVARRLMEIDGVGPWVAEPQTVHTAPGAFRAQCTTEIAGHCACATGGWPASAWSTTWGAPT